MFNITDTPEFTHEVRVQTPVDGGHREEIFKARFRVVNDEEQKIDFYKVGEASAFLRTVLVGMEDLVDGKGKAVPYSDAVRDKALALPHVRLALFRAYNAAFTAARTGN